MHTMLGVVWQRNEKSLNPIACFSATTLELFHLGFINFFDFLFILFGHIVMKLRGGGGGGGCYCSHFAEIRYHENVRELICLFLFKMA